MKFTAIDLELNQPDNKIIQIGAAEFDTDLKSGNITDRTFMRFIDRETNWEHVLNTGKTLRELLPHSPEHFKEKGIKIDLGLREFRDWLDQGATGKKIIQWGSGDFALILGEMKEHGLEFKRRYQCFNFKQSYQFLIQPAFKLHKGGGLGSAINAMELEFYGKPHSAIYDAINTGLLFTECFLRINKLYQIEKLFLRKEQRAELLPTDYYDKLRQN